MAREQDERPQPPRWSGGSAYSTFVGAMKLVLPAVAVALVLLVVVWPQLAVEDDRFGIDLSELMPDQTDTLSMLNARFEGRDSRDRPFSVVADLATQETSDADLVDLERPKADVTLEDGAWLALRANEGKYWREAEVLELFGEVSLFHDRGFQMDTVEAEVDLKAGQAKSDRPVAGHGPDGVLQAQGFRLSDQGDRIFFTGKSRLTLYHHAVEGGAVEGAAVEGGR